MRDNVSYRRTTLSLLWAALVAWPMAGTAQIAIPVDTCDYITSEGKFNTTANRTHRLARANFTFIGGCKNGSLNLGNLNYTDQGNGLRLTATNITAYIWAGNGGLNPDRPIGTRIVCGTAKTNIFGKVNFRVVVHDAGKTGIDDVFMIRLRNKNGKTVYTTENPQEDFTLGGAGSGGGNIQIHKQTGGSFGGSCPAFF